MHIRKSRVGTIMGLLLVLLAVANTAVASSNKNFRTHLSGAEEIPVRVTNAQGQAIFRLSKDGQSLEYKLIVANIKNVFQAHLHYAEAGKIGPIVVWLYPAPDVQEPKPIPGRTNGILAEGTIRAEHLLDQLEGKPLSALIDAINSGEIYVNVHTNDFVDPANTGPGDFPGGEIRGQLHNH